MLPEAIIKHEKEGKKLVTMMDIVGETINKLLEMPGEKGKAKSDKCKCAMCAKENLRKCKIYAVILNVKIQLSLI